ncbi:hypothetical protein KBY78_09290 [Synechococcus sp. EJ6-Ellesmere]|nr:hypothetical protein [Synechococcus sp. EJ6-Ellesmere]
MVFEGLGREGVWLGSTRSHSGSGFWWSFPGNVRGEPFMQLNCFNLYKKIFLMLRIPLTLLKPAVCLLLGASAIFTTTAASALTTYSLTFSSDTIGNTLSGSFDIDDSDPAAQDFTFSFVSIEPWLTNLSLTETISGVSTTYDQSNYSGFVWHPSPRVDFTLDLVPQFFDINFFAANSSAPTDSIRDLSGKLSARGEQRPSKWCNSGGAAPA